MDPEFEMESVCDNDSDPVMLSYATICDTIKPVLGDAGFSFVIQKVVQAISHALEGEISVNVPELHEVPDLTVQTSAVSVFDQVSLATMAKTQAKFCVLGLVNQYLCKGENIKSSAISKNRCKAVCKYLLQFD